MSVTVIAFVTVNEDQPFALARYLEVTTPLLDQAGAKIIQHFKVDETVVGKKPAQTVIFVKYPNRQAVDQVFDSKAYKEIIPLRDEAFSDYEVTIVSDTMEPEASAEV